MVRTFLQETFVVQDCFDYEKMIDNSDQSKWTIPSAVSSSGIFGYSSDGWKFGNANSYSRIIHNTSLSSAFCVEFTLTELYGNGLIHYIYSNGSTPNAEIQVNTYENTIRFLGTAYNYTFTTGDKFRVEWMNGTAKLYLNDVLFAEGTHNVTFPTNVELHTGSNRYCRIKEFKIKAL